MEGREHNRHGFTPGLHKDLFKSANDVINKTSSR